MMKAVTKWFHEGRGFGFLILQEGAYSGQEAFVHYTSLTMEGFKTLVPGQLVLVDIEETERGLQAKNVRSEV